MSPAITATEPKPGATASPPSPPKQHVTVKVALPKDSEDAGPRVRYWMGTLPECPVQNVTSGGQSFPRFSGTPSFDDAGSPDRNLEFGTYLELTAEQVERVKHSVAMRVVRTVGGDGSRKRGIICQIDSPHYRRQAEDVPLARLVYMTTASRSDVLPPPMLEE